MKRIDHEISLLLEMSSADKLPSYPTSCTDDSFYVISNSVSGISEYFSGENHALEAQLKTLWTHDARLQSCIPVILAAVEKSRGNKSREVAHTELYNYTM